MWGRNPSKGRREDSGMSVLSVVRGLTSTSTRDLGSLKSAFPSGGAVLVVEELGMGFGRSMGHV